MHDLKKTYDLFNIRAEVLISELLDRTELLNNKTIALKPVGDFNKSLKNDITGTQLYENDLEENTYYIDLARKGMYDALPPGLFHNPSSKIAGAASNKKEKILQDLKERKQEEKDARLFFQPFDIAFNHQRLILEQEERKVLTGFPVGSRHTLFDMIWGGIGQAMSNDQKSALFSILPMAHSISGNTQFTEFAFGAILGFNTSIEKEYSNNSICQDNKQKGLNDMRLAVDTVLGSKSDEQEMVYQIHFTKIPSSKIQGLLPEGKTREVVVTLCDFLLPIETNYSCTYHFEEKPLYTDDPQIHRSFENRLGYGITL